MGSIINKSGARPVILAQLSLSANKVYTAINAMETISFDTQAELIGITHSTVTNPDQIRIDSTRTYVIVAQPQVLGGAAGDFFMWLQRDTGGGFFDVADSSVKLNLANNDEDVIILDDGITLNDGDVIRIASYVTNLGVSLETLTPILGPRVPACILRVSALG